MTHMIDESHTVDVAYLGFAKVFHSVNHRFLLQEFKSLGLGDAIVRWIEAYLTGRVLRVHVSGERSGTILVRRGRSLPQRIISLLTEHLFPHLFACIAYFKPRPNQRLIGRYKHRHQYISERPACHK